MFLSNDEGDDDEDDDDDLGCLSLSLSPHQKRFSRLKSRGHFILISHFSQQFNKQINFQQEQSFHLQNF